MELRLEGDPGGYVLGMPDLLLGDPAPLLSEARLPSLPLAEVVPGMGRGLDTGSRLPVLIGDAHYGDNAWRSTEHGLDLSIDVFGSVFLCLSRMEELIVRARDRHDRFPAAESLAVAAGLLERPIVDEYVDLLFAGMRRLWPALQRPATAFRLRPTHDVDRPFAAFGQARWVVARSLAADLLKRRQPRLAARRLRAVADARAGRVDRDPYATYDFLMTAGERAGVRSTFYFLAGALPDEPDFRYRLDDPRLRPVLRSIGDRGHEIGLHASYQSYRQPERLAREREALVGACHEAGVEQAAWGVRSHYLRLAVPETWRDQEAAGLVHDSSLGYAEAIGFRSGTCREHPLFDLGTRRLTSIRERPLVVMDTTLFGYHGWTEVEAAKRMAAVLRACRAHRGDAVILFHNDTVADARRRALYLDVLKDLTTSVAGG